jgi:type II secretory pathway component PulC
MIDPWNEGIKMKMRRVIFAGHLCVMAAFVAFSGFTSAQDEAMQEILLDNTKQNDKIVCETGKCKVLELRKDSLFREMGLKEGDVIKKWNGKSLSKTQDTKFIFNTINEQQQLVAVIDRSGKEIILHLPKENP